MRTSLIGSLGVLLAALCVTAAPIPAAAQGRPAQTVRLDTLFQLCALKQREIIAHHKSIMESSIAYANARDPGAKDRLLQTIKSERQAAADAELTWQRLSCFELLYRSPQPAGR